MSEQRLIDLETKIAHQEYLLEELHQVIYQQQKNIDRLDLTLSSLTKRLQESLRNEDSEIRAHNEKPPHY